MMREVTMDAPLPDGLKQAAFVAVTAWVPVYRDYHDLPAGSVLSDSLVPMVLLQQRWDGRVGFPGGKVDPDESLVECAAGEAAEEAGILIEDHAQLSHVISHETARMRLHLLRLDLGCVSMAAAKLVLHRAVACDHVISEGVSFWAHLATYGRGDGWPVLRASNTLQTAVAEELDAVRALMGSSIPVGGIMRDG